MSLRVALTHVFAWPEVRRGGERYLHELASALRDAGHDVTILTTGPAPRRDRVLGVDVRYLRRRGRALAPAFRDLAPDAAFGAQAFAHLAAKRFDVWHALGAPDAAAATVLSRLRGVRSVHTDLGVPERYWRSQRKDGRLHAFVARYVDGYVCLSKTAGRFLERDYGRSPAVVGGGVDLRAFKPAPARHPDPVLLFTAAADEPRKNLPLLLDAVAILRRRRPSLELWLAGPGDAASALAAAPREARDAVVAHGPVSLDELRDRYARAWATVLPSHGEAFGLVLVESLAGGTPVVALEDGAPAELVTPDVGATCAPDPAALADACDRALELAAQPGVADACRAAAEPHDWRTGVVPRIEAVYRGEVPVSLPSAGAPRRSPS